jgi:hypothetical protein
MMEGSLRPRKRVIIKKIVKTKWRALGTKWRALGTKWRALGTKWRALGTKWRALGTKWRVEILNMKLLTITMETTGVASCPLNIDFFVEGLAVA